MKSVILSCAGALSFAVAVAVHRPVALEFPGIMVIILMSFQIGLLIWCVCGLIKSEMHYNKTSKALITNIEYLNKEIAEIEERQKVLDDLESTYNQS